MQGKWKKVTTATVASAIIAAQAVMQVSAAGGSINADMSTKVPVLRVKVPTAMAVSVNEFQMGDAGSQVTSGVFDMKNLSEIPVNVEVTSTATLGAGVTLVGTRAEAEASTNADSPAMWLAAVAAIKDNGSSLEYAEGDDVTVKALTGTEANATAFTTTDSVSTAVQNFYLKEAKAAQYKAIIGADALKIGAGADYYKLTAESTITDQNTLDAALKLQDIYVANAAPTASTDTDDNSEALTKIAKGGTGTWASGKQYYTMASAATAYGTVSADTSGIYMYIDSATGVDGDAAAFRYAGALSGAKTSWSTSDLSAITIAYDITGISTDAYGAIAGDDGSGLTYGYRAETSAAKSPITLNSAGLMTIKGFVLDDFNAASITVSGETKVYTINSQSGKWDLTKDPVEYQFNETFVNLFKGKTVTIEITQKNDKPTLEGTFTIAND